MDFRIYIQSLNKFPISDWACSAYLGFKEKSQPTLNNPNPTNNVFMYEFIDDIIETKLSKTNIIVGFIEDVSKYLEALGMEVPNALNIPPELISYAGREIRYMSMSEFKQDTRVPVFVKPNGRNKEFSGVGVLTRLETKACFQDVPDDTPVLVSEVVDFVSEYRCYVIEKKLIGIINYRGDIRVFPDVSIIDKAIEDYTSQPAGYSLDFGITSDGRTLLVECQDGWSLANYGISDVDYSRLLSARWLQLVGIR